MLMIMHDDLEDSPPPTVCGVWETLWALVHGLPNSQQVAAKLK
jgi:hypothetical protein